MAVKIHVKMQNLGEKSQSPMTDAPHKSVVRYPSVSISKDQLHGIGDLKVGKKARIIFEVECTGIQQPSPWEIENGGKEKGDIIVQLNLLKGALDKVEGEE